MIRSILVCTDGSEYGDVACQYGVDLARRLKARLLGLHVLDSRMLDGPLMADISGLLGAQPYGGQVQQFRDLMEQKGAAVIRAFDERCAAAGLAVDSVVKTGHPPRVILEEEARAELLVLGQKGEHAGIIGDASGSVIEQVVRKSVQPCLVTPGKFQRVTKILAAYDGSGHASRALQEAAELSLALAVELIVVTVDDNGDEGRAARISQDAARLVKDHECKADILLVKGPAATLILETARDRGCDLVVVGAYGHSRIRELMLGSTTTQMITRARTPVMLVR